MKLYFLRHADAVDGEDDAARPLSPAGREQSVAVAKFLAQSGVIFDAAFASPLVRAHQTAEIVLRTMGLAGLLKLQTADALSLNASEAGWQRWLDSLSDHRHVLLVGHAPSLAQRARTLLGMSDSSALNLPKGALVCIKSDNRRSGRLKFMVTPKSLGL